MNKSHILKNKTRYKYQKIPKYVKSLSFPKFTRKSKSKSLKLFPRISPPQFVLVPPPENTYLEHNARRIDPIKNAGKSEIIVLLVLHGQDLPTNLSESLKENTLMFNMDEPGKECLTLSEMVNLNLLMNYTEHILYLPTEQSHNANCGIG
jgi:hypothetical protein